MTARADHLMTTVTLLALVVIGSSPVLLALIDGTKDTANRFPETWSLPSHVCFGDSGAPTFVDDPREPRAPRRLVAIVSDGGPDCANTDARVRVDTAAMQTWVTRVIREQTSGAR